MKPKHQTGSFWNERYFEGLWTKDNSDWVQSKRATQEIMNILCGQSLSNEDADMICKTLAVCRNPHILPPLPPYRMVIGKK